MNLITGLVSISFRSLSAESILHIAKEAGLEAIEWGSDVHVPAGDIAVAERIRKATLQNGLRLPEYGAYYVLGSGNEKEREATIRSARALGTSMIRLWATEKNRKTLSEKEYAAAVDDAKRMCIENPDLTFCLECHNHSITEDYHDALTYLHDVGQKNLRMFWQPNQFRSHEYNVEALVALLPYIDSIHVFSWEGDHHYPLAHHTDRWHDYLSILRQSPKNEMYLMLEFMYDHKPETLFATAKTLHDWIDCLYQ